MTTEVKKHARFSPSGASKWIRCPGSLALESVCPDKPSKYAMEGTAAHTLAEKVLTDGNFYARAYLGEVIKVTEMDGKKEVTLEFEVDDDMADHVQNYVDNIRKRMEEFKLMGDVRSVTLLVEQQIDFSRIIDIPEQFGTADVVIVVEFKDGTALISVEDLKYGMGVKVDALDNEQLLTYATGALDEYSMIYNVTKVNVAVHQIRLDHISEAMYTADEILEFGAKLKVAAKAAKSNLDAFENGTKAKGLNLEPGDKQCRWCKAAATCPALAERAFNNMLTEMDETPVPLEEMQGKVEEMTKKAIDKLDRGLVSLEQLAEFMKAADLLDDLLRAVRGRVEAELYDGKDVPGYKLVEGRRGSRAWVNMVTAEATLKSMRLKQDEMYTKKLVSPTQAEKLLGKENPRRWKTLQKLIWQPAGKTSVAPLTDKRPAVSLSPTSDEYEDFSQDTGEDLV